MFISIMWHVSSITVLMGLLFWSPIMSPSEITWRNDRWPVSLLANHPSVGWVAAITLTPRIWCCHHLPPCSLLTLWASESLSYSHVSFNLIYNVLHERYIIQTYMDEIYKHVFRLCAIWDIQAFSLMTYCGFNIEPFCSEVCGDHQRPLTPSEICRNMGICCSGR